MALSMKGKSLEEREQMLAEFEAKRTELGLNRAAKEYGVSHNFYYNLKDAIERMKEKGVELHDYGSVETKKKHKIIVPVSNEDIEYPELQDLKRAVKIARQLMDIMRPIIE